MESRILLVTLPDTSGWAQQIGSALKPLGQIDLVSPGDAPDEAADERVALILMDATTIADVEKVITTMRSKRADARVVVLTASPTWRRARAAFEAGAIDYLPKTLGLDDLTEALREAACKRAGRRSP